MACVHTVTTETVNSFKNKFMLKEYVNMDVSMLTYDSGDVYIGQQIKKQKNGLGSMYYANGDVYTGNWADDISHGCGVFISKSGIKYVGKWRNGKLHGRKMQIQFPDDSFYEGNVIQGNISGTGTMIYKNSETIVYKGEWLNGQWHGKGAVKYVDGEIYNGSFHQGERRGEGKCVWPSGVVYEGEWADDTLHGQGILDARGGLDKRIHMGPWEYGTQLNSGYTITFAK